MGNTASTEALLWSIGSILALFAVLGVVVYVVHRYGFFYGESKAVQAAYKLLETPVTPSQRAAAKFFLVAGLLFVVQIFNGGLLAHYTVHPGKLLRELHRRDVPLQLGQDLAPATGHPLDRRLVDGHGRLPGARWSAGREPRGQRLLVNILFVAAVAVAVGSLPGEVLGIKGFFNPWASTPGSGWATRAGNISNWAGSGRSCSSAG